jgi:hypothetical protein
MNVKPALQGFSKGISSLTLFPTPPRRAASADNAWSSVSKAFQSVGNNMRKVLGEQQAPGFKEGR